MGKEGSGGALLRDRDGPTCDDRDQRLMLDDQVSRRDGLAARCPDIVIRNTGSLGG